MKLHVLSSYLVEVVYPKIVIVVVAVSHSGNEKMDTTSLQVVTHVSERELAGCSYFRSGRLTADNLGGGVRSANSSRRFFVNDLHDA